MFNENFYNLKTAVMTHQNALREILAEHGINAEGLSIYEMVPHLRNLKIDLSFITAEANDILEGKVSVDKDGNQITGVLKPGTDVSATTADGVDVLKGKQFYNASGVLTQGSLVIPEDTGVDVSATTATAPDVLNGKKFYNSAGVLTTGTLVPQSGGGSAMDFFKCAAVGPAESGDTEDGGDTTGSSADIIVSGAGSDEFNGTYSLTDLVNESPNPNFTDSHKPVYKKGNEEAYLFFDPNAEQWVIAPQFPLVDAPYYASKTTWTDSPTAGSWMVADANAPAPTVTLASGGSDSGSTSEIPANTWNGYKAILVEETTTTEGETVLIVSGSGIADGNYKLMDSTATGSSRIWKHTDSEWYFVWTGSSWVINASPTYERGQEAFYPDTTDDENPWDVTTWWGDDGIVNMTITQQTTEGTSETKKYYTFEDTLTEGLTYGKGFTPEVDKVYDSEAMIMATLSIALPVPVLPVPVWENALNSKSGFSVTGTVTEGDNCLTFSDGGALATTIDKFPQGNKPFSFAISFKNAVDKNEDYNMIFSIGARPTSNYVFVLGFSRGNGGKLTVSTWGDLGIESTKSLTGISDWQRVMIVNDGNGKAYMYINGELEATGSGEFNISDVTCEFGGAFWDYNHFEGSLADCKVWDVALTAGQVAAEYGKDTAPTMPVDGLELYFPFENDLTEKVNNLTPNSGYDSAKFYIAEDSTVGKYLKADNAQSDFYFNGTENVLQVGTGDFTISVYLDASAWGNGWVNMALFKGDITLLYNEPTYAGKLFGLLQSNSVAPSGFHHWTWVRKNSMMTCYLDGVAHYTYESTDNLSNTGVFGLLTSRNYWSYSQGLHATWGMKALRMYNRALTEDEIKTLASEFAK